MQVREERELVYAPVLNEPLDVVVAVSPPESAEFVPHANPLVVELTPPVMVMVPFRVAVVAARVLAACVVTVGGFKSHAPMDGVLGRNLLPKSRRTPRI